MIAAIRANARPERRDLDTDAMPAGQRLLGEWRAGLRLIRGDRALSAIFLAFSLGFLGEGTFEVGFVPLAVSVLGGGAASVGILLSAQAIGGILAGAGIARVSTLVAPACCLVVG